jgi:hypothetical protein
LYKNSQLKIKILVEATIETNFENKYARVKFYFGVLTRQNGCRMEKKAPVTIAIYSEDGEKYDSEKIAKLPEQSSASHKQSLSPGRRKRTHRSFSTEQKVGKIPTEILRKLPKAELHCHLDGAVRLDTIIELAEEQVSKFLTINLFIHTSLFIFYSLSYTQGVELPTFDIDELAKLVVVDQNCDSLVKYLRGFDITLLVLQKACMNFISFPILCVFFFTFKIVSLVLCMKSVKML